MRLLPGHDELDRFRTVGDPLADAVVDVFVERRIQPTDPVASLRLLAHEGQPDAEALWEHVNTVPDWVDFEAMEGAYEVALQNFIPSGLSLMAGSLVESYASANGAKVLVKTGRLERDTLRRLFETAKFASDLALHRGARPGNPAWRNVIAVRSELQVVARRG